MGGGAPHERSAWPGRAPQQTAARRPVGGHKELRRTLGEPTVLRERQSRLEVYDYAPDGDGVVLVRLSFQDIQNGETALGQARGVFEFCQRLDLAPRHVLVMLNCGSKVAYEQRIDWQLLRDGARSGWLRWVAVREADRVSRNEVAAALFYRDIKAFDLRLYMSDLGRQIDLDDPAEKFVLNTFTNVGVFEAAQIRKRTMRPIQTRWIEEGRGWPKQPRFGFRRDAQDFLEVDPEQWPFVERIHFDYATLDPLGGTSIRRLQRHVESLGCSLSPAQVARILRDPIYVDGEWTCKFEKKVWPCRRVELPNPIPREVFDRNQALLSTMQGAPKKRPLGYFALNHVRLLHRGCLEQGRANAQHLLRGQREDYRHVKCPMSSCWGLTIPREALDELVVGKLLELCESEELQRAWATLPESATRDGAPGDDEIESIEADLRLRRRQLEEANRQWLDRSARAPSADLLGTFERATGVLVAEVESLERRLEHAQRVKAAQADLASGERRGELLRRAREVLTPSAPDDPDLAQRRVAFISQAIDEVIVEVNGDEVEVEIFGPLVERQRPSRADPIRHAGSLLSGPHDCLAEQPLRDSREAACDRSGRRHAWRSPRIAFHVPRIRPGVNEWRRRREDVLLAVLRTASASAPAGPLPLPEVGRGRASSEAGFRPHAFVRSVLGRFGVVDRAWRTALGDDAALKLGRVRPATVEEWAIVLRRAIDAGLRFGPGWQGEWDAFARVHGWLPSTSTLRIAEKELSFRVDELVAEVAAGRVQPPRRWEAAHRPSTLEDCLEVVRRADARLPVGRLTYEALEAVTRADDDVPLIRTIAWRLRNEGLRLHDAIIVALGPERALSRARTTPKTEAEWRVVMRMALIAGLDPARVWPSWKALAQQHAWLPSPYAFRERLPHLNIGVVVREEAGHLEPERLDSTLL